MGDTIKIRSDYDGFELSAYHAQPNDARRGGLLHDSERGGRATAMPAQ